MIPAHRQRFNREFTEPRYAAFVAAIEQSCGAHVDFRLSETPFFLPASLLARLEGVAQELIGQLLSNARLPERPPTAMVPEPFRHAHGETRPTFLQVDFGLVQTPVGHRRPAGRAAGVSVALRLPDAALGDRRARSTASRS